MDLPLSEDEQLTITRVLGHHYADYDLVGTLYTRSSGTRRFVEVELGFGAGLVWSTRTCSAVTWRRPWPRCSPACTSASCPCGKPTFTMRFFF